MYESFFGLKVKAFSLTPDPEFLYLNERTKEAFDDILYAIERREGFAVIVGDVGTGKTTLSCALLGRIEGKKDIRTVLIQNPMLSELDILRCIVQDLGVHPENAVPGHTDDPQMFGAAWTRNLTKKELIECLNTFLAERAREDAFTVLIIDESQNLSLEMLEQLRLLSNLETTKKKLLQIILLGQLELEQKLAKLRQLNQRVSVRFETRALSRTDAEKYIRHRLSVAGDAHKVKFGLGAIDAIHRCSGGYPRLINLICDRGLREAYRQRSFTITTRMVHKASLNLGAGQDVLLKDRSRRLRVAAVVALLLLAAAAAFVFLINKKMTSAIEPSVSGARSVNILPTPEIRADESPMQRTVAASSPLPAVTQKSQEYVLQVYSFRSQEVAEDSAKQLEELNFTSFVVYQAGEGNDGWYGVYVGPFPDQEAARRTEAALRSTVGASPVLRGSLRAR